MIRGYLMQLGEIEVPFKSWEDIDATGNNFFVTDASYVPRLEEYMDALRKSGDSIGAKLSVVAHNVPVGWGEPVFDRLDADIAHALMSINAVKGVEIGAGFGCVTQHGSEHGDEFTPDGFLSNNAGGILGGISTGQDIVAQSPSSRPPASASRASPSIRRASRQGFPPKGAMIPASASAPRRLPRPCWRWC